ncbi:SIR2 family protein [Cryobacterium sp. M23]|uniref:SIR2 family NAD-dependent protein deacylase n=1 Tax=Cryobacterium sp. M23 TaxID=2048292 RepID=UPI000CE30BB8|nr:SIR2 family protein [Cryobacterium sp. M23]
MQAIEKLREALGRGDVVVVAGTGVSAGISNNSPAGTWLGLLADGISHVEKKHENRGALLRLRVENYLEDPRVSDLTNIASELRQELNEGDHDRFPRWLSSAIGELPVEDKSIPDALAALGAPLFTTNYDTLLEQSTGRASATWSQPDTMRKIANYEVDAIGHLHGIWSDASSVIFTADDYRRIVSDSAAQTVQTSAFTMKTFLFVGFGSGTEDPNFKSMINDFARAFPGTHNAHFRLCRASEMREESTLDAVVDISYGESHEELPGFLHGLKVDKEIAPSIDARSRSLEHLENRIRDNSALWRDTETLDDKSIRDLIVTPIFLPEPHDQYATNSVLESERNRVDPVDIAEHIESSDVIVVAGEENSGVSTALAWILHEAMTANSALHAITVDEPLVAGPRPISKTVERIYRDWNINPAGETEIARCVLGVDNLRFETSERFQRAIRDLSQNASKLKVIGVRQHDALEIVNALKAHGVANVSLVYLGRFSNSEAQELARRVAPGDEQRVVQAVMIVIREKHLPRNPFTITLLIELIRNGSNLKEEDSEIAVLDQYLNLLLIGEFIRERSRSALTLRNKRFVLVALARKLVEAREDKATATEFIGWVSELFADLGWPHDAWDCISDLIKRRVLSRGPENTIRFQRSAYLELMAGIAAQEDDEFRKLVFSAPLQLASIVRTYAAMSRNDAAVLELMERQIELITVAPPSGAIFGNIRRLEAPQDLFKDSGGAAEDQAEAQPDAVERGGISRSYYDDTDDSDRPAFLTARIEDLSPARIAMLVVDLASRVLRDTDESRDQQLKARVLRKLLVAWVGFVDLYESELKDAPDIDDVIREVHKKDDATDDEFKSFKAAVLRVLPCFVTLSGIQYCLSSPSLVPLLGSVQMSGMENAHFGGLIRTLALYASDSTAWVDSLSTLEPRAVKSWFSAGFLSSVARYAYISDVRLTDDEREKIRQYLRQVIGERYDFSGIDHRNRVMNSFEDKLRKARLGETRRPQRSLNILT